MFISRYSLIVGFPGEPGRRKIEVRAGADAAHLVLEASKLTFFGSRDLQESSKSPPRGFLKAFASKMRFGPHFGFISGSENRGSDLKNEGVIPKVGNRGSCCHDVSICPMSADMSHKNEVATESPAHPLASRS